MPPLKLLRRARRKCRIEQTGVSRRCSNLRPPLPRITAEGAFHSPGHSGNRAK
jgi:hypothetical protein